MIGIVLPALLLAFLAMVWAFVLEIHGPVPGQRQLQSWISTQWAVVITAPVRLRVFGHLTFDAEAIKQATTVRLRIGGPHKRVVELTTSGYTHADGSVPFEEFRLSSATRTLMDMEAHADLMKRLRAKYGKPVEVPRATVSYPKLVALASSAV